MEKVILWGVQGGAIALDSESQEMIAFIPGGKIDEFEMVMNYAGIETAGYQLGTEGRDAYERAAQTHMDEIIKAFKGET